MSYVTQIENLLKSGDAYIMRENVNSFFVLVIGEQQRPLDQILAKEWIKLPFLIQERWHEGWVEAKESGKVRWRARHVD